MNQSSPLSKDAVQAEKGGPVQDAKIADSQSVEAIEQLEATKSEQPEPSHGSRALTWSIAIIGTIGVTWLLMILAGVFTTKVDPDATLASRMLPAGANVAAVRLVVRPKYETAVGTIKPVHEAAVASKILAKVDQVLVTAGQEVQQGDVVIVLNDADLSSRLKQSEAARESAAAQASQAQIDFRRAQQLIQNNTISRAEYDSYATAVKTSAAELERAERAIDEARVMLSYATINAPFSGIVIEKHVEPGDTVSPGQPLLNIYDPTQMQLVANVRESLATRLRVGQQVPAKLESLDHECMATVREVVPQADTGSRSFQVKVSGPCPPGLYSGMFGRIMLPLDDENIMTIPTAAIQHVGQLTLVDLVDGDRLIRHNIQVGRSFGDETEVLAGLKIGEQVLVPETDAPEIAVP